MFLRIVPIVPLLCSLAFQGCAGKTTPEITTATAIENGVWYLVEYGPLEAPVPPVPDVEATITIDQATEQVSGTAGCNRFSGSFRVTGSDVQVGPLAATKKLCPEPPGVMAQEQAVLAAFSTVTRYTLEEGTLTFYYGSDEGIRFTSTAPTATESNDTRAFLQRHEGQYPRDSKLWEDPVLLPRLQQLLGDDLAVFLTNMQVQGPLQQEDGVYFVTGNEAHEGGHNMAVFVADPAREQIQVWLAVGGEPRTYVEKKPALTYPSEVLTLLNNLKDTP